VSKIQKLRKFLSSDTGTLILLGLAILLLHTLLNERYGFHRDELNTLENARHLAWGYVEYPPLAPFLVRLAYNLFGPNPIGLRFISAFAMSISLVLAGLMASDMGGRRNAQILTALSTAIAPYVLLYGGIGMYETYDYFWWVVVFFLVVHMLKTENPRWWLGIGAAIGFGMMSKYSMGFLVIGIIVGVAITRARRYLLSPWLWVGVGIALLIFLPNLIWQVQHDFISVDFLQSIHARDIRIGRGESFLSEQFWACTNLITVPIWVAGLFFILFARSAKAFRMVAWMVLVPFGMFFYLQGRSYYLTGVYPVLLAAGSVAWEMGLERVPHTLKKALTGVTYGLVILSGAAFSLIALPLAPVGSDLFTKVSGINKEFREQVGWPELVESVAVIYAKLPEDEKAVTGILAGNYGEAGAVDLYGPKYGLPEVISGVNTYFLRGYGTPSPQTLIVLGIEDVKIYSFFNECGIEGRISNPYNIPNEEYLSHSRIYVCRGLRKPWDEIWKFFQDYG
jgi:4-amino-4-deoxy-L-arabinose transferase-like glycosyltransferase